MRKVCALLVSFWIMGMVSPGALAAQLEVAGKSSLLMDVATGTVLHEANAHPIVPGANLSREGNRWKEGSFQRLPRSKAIL